MVEKDIWGRPLEKYAYSYTIHSSQELSLHTGSEMWLRITAEGSIDKISQLAGRESAADLRETSQITLKTLESVLMLTLSPDIFRDFACPSLISGCIKLMPTVQVSGTASPFSREYGYLCFRIVTIALGACLLQRSSRLDKTISEMSLESETDIEMLDIFAENVAELVQDEIQSHMDGMNCDWILGWGESDGRPHQDPLLLESDVLQLWDLLFEDRKMFLKALYYTDLPGLSGVMFLLWQYWHLQRRIYNDADDAKLLAAPLCEIIWRYTLVAPTDQELPLTLINNDIGDLAILWDKSSPVFDLEDSLSLILAFSARLSPENREFYEPLNVTAIPILLRFVLASAGPGSEGELPKLIRLAINRIWDDILDQEQEDLVYVDITQSTFLHLGKLLHSMSLASRPIVSNIVETLIECDFIDLTTRVMLMLRPEFNELSPADLPTNNTFLAIAQALFEFVSRNTRSQAFKSKLDESFQDWLKYKSRLLCPPDLAFDEAGIRHFRMCSEYWDGMAKALSRKQNLAFLKQHQLDQACSYARCPDPLSVGGAQFACSRCFTLYCSSRCQTADWMSGDWRGPHYSLCQQA